MAPRTPDAAKEAKVVKQDPAFYKHLNDASFVKFLAASEKATGKEVEPTPENEAHFTERYEAFERQKAVSKQVVELYKGKWFEDAGLKFEQADAAPLEQYCLELAASDPAGFEKLRESVDQFKAIPAQIEKQQAELQKYLPEFKDDAEKNIYFNKIMAGESNAIKAKGGPEGLLGVAWQGFLYAFDAKDSLWNKEKKEGYKAQLELGKQKFSKNDIEAAIKNGELSRLQKSFEDAKGILFAQDEIGKEILVRARERAQANLRALEPGYGTAEGIENYARTFQKLQTADNSVDYFGGIDVSGYNDKIKADSENLVKTELKRSLDSITPEKSTLSEVEKTFKKIIERSEDEENSEGYPNKEFLGVELKKIAEDPANNVSAEKKLLVKALIQKYELNA